VRAPLSRRTLNENKELELPRRALAAKEGAKGGVAVIGLFGAAGFAWANSRVAHTHTHSTEIEPIWTCFTY
jgi:hypothetical protein